MLSPAQRSRLAAKRVSGLQPASGKGDGKLKDRMKEYKRMHGETKKAWKLRVIQDLRKLRRESQGKSRGKGSNASQPKAPAKPKAVAKAPPFSAFPLNKTKWEETVKEEKEPVKGKGKGKGKGKSKQKGTGKSKGKSESASSSTSWTAPQKDYSWDKKSWGWGNTADWKKQDDSRTTGGWAKEKGWKEVDTPSYAKKDWTSRTDSWGKWDNQKDSWNKWNSQKDANSWESRKDSWPTKKW